MPDFSDADRGELLHLQVADKPVNLAHAHPIMLCIHLVCFSNMLVCFLPGIFLTKRTFSGYTCRQQVNVLMDMRSVLSCYFMVWLLLFGFC